MGEAISRTTHLQSVEPRSWVEAVLELENVRMGAENYRERHWTEITDAGWGPGAILLCADLSSGPIRERLREACLGADHDPSPWNEA